MDFITRGNNYSARYDVSLTSRQRDLGAKLCIESHEIIHTPNYCGRRKNPAHNRRALHKFYARFSAFSKVISARARGSSEYGACRSDNARGVNRGRVSQTHTGVVDRDGASETGGGSGRIGADASRVKNRGSVSTHCEAYGAALGITERQGKRTSREGYRTVPCSWHVPTMWSLARAKGLRRGVSRAESSRVQGNTISLLIAPGRCTARYNGTHKPGLVCSA